MAKLEFDTPPRLAPAYGRALFCRRPGVSTAGDLPALSACWKGARVTEEALSRYAVICGLSVDQRIPIHYPHVLASPIHLHLLTHPEFPLSLLGAVHLRNHTIRYRPIAASETFDIHAWIQGGRMRPQGIEIDVDTRAEAGEETLWAERTTLLVRQKFDREDPASPLADVFPWNASEDVGLSLGQFQVPAGAGKRYAAITGDYNPIHVSCWLARAFGFKRDLVHGMWGAARAVAGLVEFESEGPVRVDVAFKGPLFMEHSVDVRGVDCAGGRSLRLFCGTEPRPAAQIVIRVVDPDAIPDHAP